MIRAFVMTAAALLLLPSCTALPAPTVVSNIDDDRDVLMDNMSWQIGASSKFVRVPAGFVTDYASIPPGLRLLLPKRGRYSRAAIVHDYLYWTHLCTKAQSDNILVIAMKESGVSRLRQWAIYTGVDIGGGSAWSDNLIEKAGGGVRFLSPPWQKRFGQTTWRDLQNEMRTASVKDAMTPNDNSFCVIGNSQDVPAEFAAPRMSTNDRLKRKIR